MAGYLRKFFVPSIRTISTQIFRGHSSKFNQYMCIVLSNTENQKLLNLRLYSASSTPETNEQKEEEDEAEEVKTKVVRPVIPVETSLRYMQSKAYEGTYRSDPVWLSYRRNYKGWKAPVKTRKKCIRAGIISTGNPCPICRDEYLVLDYQNVKLLRQFISPITGDILEAKVTGLCRMRQTELLIAVTKAQDYGYLQFEVPYREYDFKDYVTTNK